MRCEPYDYDRHYGHLLKWWKARDHWYVPPACLSDTGIVAFVGDVPAAAAWLFETNSKSGLIGWTVTNPEVGLRMRHRAVRTVHTGLESLARKLGLAFVFSYSDSRGLSRVMVRSGYVKQGHPHDLLIGRI